MRSFRFARRSFLAAVGGALGLRVLLDNLVAHAQGATSPPRFLMTHWPLGTVRSQFKPTGTGSGYTPSPVLQPFVDAGLRADMSVLYGLSHGPLDSGVSGVSAGMVMMATGRGTSGVRSGSTDGVAAGPSFDQIFLKNASALQTPGDGCVNVSCARAEALASSGQSLSYSYGKRSVAAEGGGAIDEAIALLPEVSPHQFYASLFAGFMPGGATPANQEALLRALKNRKSVLDFSLRELDRIKALAPGSERAKIEIHTEAVRKLEERLIGPDPDWPIASACHVPAMPDTALLPRTNVAPPAADGEVGESSDVWQVPVGQANTDVLVAALQCDLLRVATFQWAPPKSRASFKGLYPGRPEKSYDHRATSLLLADANAPLADTLPDGTTGELLQFLANVQTWYNVQQAALLEKLKDTKDIAGNSLLDFTVVPYLTEVASAAGQLQPLPALLFGGKGLGMRHGSFLDFESAPRCHNDLWVTVAQAFLGADPLEPLGAEGFHQAGVAPIAGLWAAPQ